MLESIMLFYAKRGVSIFYIFLKGLGQNGLYIREVGGHLSSSPTREHIFWQGISAASRLVINSFLTRISSWVMNEFVN